MEINQYFVTFGVQYTGNEQTGEIHPYGVTHRNYVTIEAPSLAIAQGMAGAMFGTQYAFVYDREHFIDDGTKNKYYRRPDSEAFKIAWVKPTTWGELMRGPLP